MYKILKYLIFISLFLSGLYLVTGCHINKYIHPSTYHWGFHGVFDEQGNPVFDHGHHQKKHHKHH